MIRKYVLFPFFGLVLLVSLFGCEDTVNVTSPDGWPEGIQVTGKGSAFGKPDVAIVDMGVSAEERSVQDAREAAASAMDGVIRSLLENGVAQDDIQTQQFTIQPRYDYREGEQILRGYVVTNTVSVKIRDMDNIGTVIDEAALEGGDHMRVNAIRFTIDDPTELQEEARVEAMRDARRKAEVLAEEGGVGLGKPMSISESYGSIPPVYYDRQRDAAMPETNTPIEAGELEIQVSVAVTYQIQE